MSIEPTLEDGDGGDEVVAERHQQVDVVEVFATIKTVGEIVARVDGGLHFPAVWAEEDEPTIAAFGRWAIATQSGDGDAHRKIVANATQKIGISHRFLQGSIVDEVGFFLPVRLQQDAVDGVDVDGGARRANRLDHAADAEIACFA